MLVASIPAKFSIPWANSAGGSYINAIPTNSQIGIIAGAASLTDGFPPTTMQTGGTPPAGPDFNGILKWVTQWGQWQAAGGPVAYDSTFQTAVSGYPLGAVVASATTFGVSWMSTVDGNTTNPDTGGAGWVKIKGLGPYAATDTGTANALAINVPAISALAAGTLFIVKKSSSANTAATTINVNSFGAGAVVWADGSVLQANDWPASVTALLEYDGAQFNLLSVMGPTLFARSVAGTRTQIYSGPGTATFTPTVTGWHSVEVYGAGGGGCVYSGAGETEGGGGGGSAEGWVYLTAGVGVTVTVGAAGTNSAVPTTPGTTGGTSSFGAYMSATGGAGANIGTIGLPGAGGVGSGGQINLIGQAGGDGCGSAATGGMLVGFGGAASGPHGGKGANVNPSNSNYNAASQWPGGGGTLVFISGTVWFSSPPACGGVIIRY